MDPTNTDSATTDGEAEPARLSTPAFALALGVTLAIFFLLNPFWESLDVVEADQNVWWSYVPIPLLVLGLLRWEEKLSGAAWFLETLKLTFVKFAVTYVVANVWWTLGEAPTAVEPPPRAAAVSSAGAFAPHEPPAPTPLEGTELARVSGRVLDAAGAPVAGAFVYVAAGLEGLVFAAPTEPLELAHGGDGFVPARAICQVHRPLRLRSAPDALHTAHLTDPDDRDVLNVPAVAGGERTLMFARERGVLRVECRVHGHDEAASELAVFSHPFVALTDADGGFAFDGVPVAAGALEARQGEQVVRATLTLAADAPAEVELRLP